MSAVLVKGILGSVVLAMTLLACSDSSSITVSPETAAISIVDIDGCLVTIPNGQGPPGPELTSPNHHGGDGLWTTLWPDGVVEFVPDGPGFLLEDGSLAMKFPWWRGVIGPLEITGRRLDSSAPPLRAHIPEGYEEDGFQASSLIFSSPGCWEVTGRVGEAELTFTTLVVKKG